VLNLAFEYQGQQHYQDTAMFGQVLVYKNRDQEKHQACKSTGITLLEVPYWWKRDKESVLEIIKKYRPDALLEHAKI